MSWTVSIPWWSLPVGLVIVGIVALLACIAWGERQGGGFLSGMFEGLVGIAAFFICVAAAIGICAGRWLS